MKSKIAIRLILLATLVATMACQEKPSGPSNDANPQAGADIERQEKTRADQIRVDMHVMSKCEHGVEALQQMLPVMDKFGDKVDFRLDYIGSASDDAKVLKSLHGENEVASNILELCAERKGAKAHFAFLKCMNTNYKTIPQGWELCAKEAKITPTELAACKTSDGSMLLKKSFDRSKAADVDVSPTVMIGGAKYKGIFGDRDLTRAVCNAFEDDKKPQLCDALGEVVPVNVFIISDPRCERCTDNLRMPIKHLAEKVLPNQKPKILDWNDPEGKKLFEEAGLKLLPAVLFDETVEKSPAYKDLKAFLRPAAGNYRKLYIRAEFDPTAEICNNKKDDTGNKLTDCDDPSCKTAINCREEIASRLDLFVMSECPYGKMGFGMIRKMLEIFGHDLNFQIHYIAKEKDGKLETLRGQSELDEDMRQLCTMKHYSQKVRYMEYLWCRSSNPKVDWKGCLEMVDMDADKIDKCFKEEGEQLLRQDIKLAQELKIEVSPGWMVNNNELFKPLTPGDIEKKFCEKNPDLEACKKDEGKGGHAGHNH